MNLKTHDYRTLERFDPFEVLEFGPDGNLRLTEEMSQEIARQWGALGVPSSLELYQTDTYPGVEIGFNWGWYKPRRRVWLTRLPADWEPLVGELIKFKSPVNIQG